MEEEKEQKESLKTSWELVAVLDFLSAFQPYLGLDQLNFSAEELESCLVLNNGTSGLLPELHIVSGLTLSKDLKALNLLGWKLEDAQRQICLVLC